ncbi:hypothetical protein [Saccharobesus litoralis]|nr:hypothetical protein [Saccharobesus litoralis]
MDMQQGEGDQAAFFKTFLNTEFYTAFAKRDVIGKEGVEENQTEFDFVLFASQQNSDKQTVVISEQASYIQKLGAEQIMSIKGGELLQSIYPDVEISIAYDNCGIGMPVDMIEWLKGAIKKDA